MSLPVLFLKKYQQFSSHNYLAIIHRQIDNWEIKNIPKIHLQAGFMLMMLSQHVAAYITFFFLVFIYVQ